MSEMKFRRILQMKEIKISDNVWNEILACETAEATLECLQQNGITQSLEESEQFMRDVVKLGEDSANCELDDTQLECVAGGWVPGLGVAIGSVAVGIGLVFVGCYAARVISRRWHGLFC